MHRTPQTVHLADRRSQDIEVVLVWGRRSNRLWVNVSNTSSGRIERIDVTAATALDVFNHPLAYATAVAPCR